MGSVLREKRKLYVFIHFCTKTEIIFMFATTFSEEETNNKKNFYFLFF